MNDKEILQSRLKTERPAVPEGFAQRQDALLGSLRRDPQPAVCRMPRLAIVLAVVIALAGTIAIAEVSGLKLLDFARRNATEQGLRSAEVLDGADDLIQDNVNYHATQTEYAEHIVKQAAYDGMNLYMLIESRPLREDVLLIGRKRNGFFSPLENEKMADFTGAEAVPTELVAEHAARTGKQMVYMDLSLIHISGTGAGVEQLRAQMQGKIACFAGQSGVGKSTLLNALLDLHLQTGEISRIERGKHTTRHAQLIEAGGLRVMDTPGFSLLEFDQVMDPVELMDYYPEFQPYQGCCRFQPCYHGSEPGCAVIQAAREGKISPARLERYHELLEKTRQLWRERYD